MENRMVSIIVPVYNVETYLRPCIDSLLAQTYQNLQIILVDDGSPDNCGAICDEYAQRDRRVLALHKKNGGVSNARNYALDYTEGTYITFCDSDDTYQPDWIESLVDAMEKTGSDVVVGGFTFMTEDGTMGEQCLREAGSWSLETEKDKMTYCFTMVMGKHHGGEIWDRLFRHDIIMDNGIRFCETCGNYAEDLGFVLSYSMYTNSVAAIEHCGYCYRVRRGSMMQNSVSIPKLESMHQVYLSLEPFLRKALSAQMAERIAPWFYLQMVGQQFIAKVWSSGVEPEQLRDAAVAGVADWEDMQQRLCRCIRGRVGWNLYYSASYNLELISHIRFLLGGSWMNLRICCKLIRMFRPVIDFAGSSRTSVCSGK